MILLVFLRMNIRRRSNDRVPKARDSVALLVNPATRKVRNDTDATVRA